MMTKKHAVAEVEATRWNGKYPDGTRVEVTRDNGEKMLTTTRGRAWVVCDQAVVLLAGHPGGYELRRVRAIEEKVEYLEVVHEDETMSPGTKIHQLYLRLKHLNSLLKVKEGVDGR